MAPTLLDALRGRPPAAELLQQQCAWHAQAADLQHAVAAWSSRHPQQQHPHPYHLQQCIWWRPQPCSSRAHCQELTWRQPHTHHLCQADWQLQCPQTAECARRHPCQQQQQQWGQQWRGLELAACSCAAWHRPCHQHQIQLNSSSKHGSSYAWC